MAIGNSKLDEKFWMDALDAGYEVLRCGWPDFVIIKDKEIIFVEVKPEFPETLASQGQSTRKVTPAQLRMLRLLESLGLVVRIALDGDLNKLAKLDDPRVKKSNHNSSVVKETERAIHTMRERRRA